MNMSYCRFQNTLNDLRDCANVIEAKVSGDREEGDLSRDERQALVSMVELMGNINRSARRLG